jgi:2-polyprenyl-3-methyl-5-hydroxy-6-metoxy-1,4-benzoquinol methylase
MSKYTANKFSREDANDSWAKIYGFVNPSSRVLDIGSSSGNLGKRLIDEKKCEVVGIDIDEQDIKLAKSRLTDAFVKDIETDDLTSLGTFDFVILADVLEHLLDPVAALKKIKALLKENGQVIFSIPNMAHISVRLMLLAGYFEYTDTGLLDKTHLHFYDEQEVLRIFSDAGYEIIKLDPTLSDLPSFFIEKWLKKLGLNGSKKFLQQLADSKGMVYQFIGIARPAAKSKTPSSRPVKYTQIMDQQILETEKTFQQLTDNIRSLEATISRRTQELAEKSAELDAIKGSTAWKVARTLQKASKATRNLKPKSTNSTSNDKKNR